MDEAKPFAHEKVEGDIITIGNPQCYVPINTPNGEWWENLPELPTKEESLRSIEGIGHPEIDTRAWCPSGEPYRSYVLALEVSWELMEDFGGELYARGENYLYWALANSVKEIVSRESEKILYWRVKPEVYRDMYTHGMICTIIGRMRLAMGTEINE